jgi:hypothetical protein
MQPAAQLLRYPLLLPLLLLPPVQFESLQECMARNKAVYDELLQDMQEVAEGAPGEGEQQAEQRGEQQQAQEQHHR